MLNNMLRILGVLLLSSSALFAAERKDVRVLLDFEDLSEVEQLKKALDNANVNFDVVQDNGVTGGKNCCRIVGKQGGGTTAFCIEGEKLKNWADYDYFV